MIQLEKKFDSLPRPKPANANCSKVPPIESELLLKALGSISQGVLIAGADRRMIFANDAFQEITGYVAEEILGNTCRFMQGRDTDPLAAAMIQLALDSGQTFSGEILNYKKSGVPFWNDLTVTPLLDECGAAQYFIGITRDITERKSAVAALKATEARYRLLFDHAQAGIVLHRSTTEITYANTMASALLGVEPDEILGVIDADPRWKFVGEDGTPLSLESYPVNLAISSRAAVKNLVAGVRRGCDGKLLWLMCNAYPIFDAGNAVSEVVVSFTDVTELKQTELALQSSEERLRAVVEASPVPAMLADAHGRLSYFNPACIACFGYLVSEVPTIDAWRARVHPDPDYRRLVDAMFAKQSTEPIEVVIRCKDGGERTVRATFVALQGDAAGTRMISLLDVTEQRRLERSALEAASREQRRIGMDLHDGLGQELTGLSLSLTALARRATRATGAEIERELQHLSTIAASCIATTRAIAHGLSPVEQGCDGLERALRRLVVQNKIGRMTVSVVVSGYKQPELDQPIGEAIFRIVQEALANAAKHGRATHATVEARFLASRVTIAVRDNGSGISGDASPTGFGLTFMRYRAHAIGGHLEVESPATGGTVITGSFPLRGRGRPEFLAGTLDS